MRRTLLSLGLFFALFAAAPEAAALPKYEVLTTYYDCNVWQVGWHYRDCPMNHYFSGQQSGVYKSVEQWPCDGLGEPYQIAWYEWNGSQWVWISAPPPPATPPYEYC